MNRQLVCDRFPYLPLTVTFAGRALTVEALVDTGFDGFLVAPGGTMGEAREAASVMAFTLADGSRVNAPTILGSAFLEAIGFECPVAISEMADEWIAGRAITDRLRITLDHGSRLIVEP